MKHLGGFCRWVVSLRSKGQRSEAILGRFSIIARACLFFQSLFASHLSRCSKILVFGSTWLLDQVNLELEKGMSQRWLLLMKFRKSRLPDLLNHKFSPSFFVCPRITLKSPIMRLNKGVDCKANCLEFSPKWTLIEVVIGGHRLKREP